jgi:hypothetical protein
MQIKKANLFLPVFIMILCLLFFSCSKNAQEIFNTDARENSATSDGDEPVSVYNSQQLWEVDIVMSAPCANNGEGEDVQLKGYVHFTDHYTVNGRHFTLVSQANYNELSGVELVTGDKYVANGGGRLVIQGVLTNGQFSASGTDRINLIGSGPGNNAVVVFKGRVIVNANGTIIHELVDITMSCK